MNTCVGQLVTSVVQILHLHTTKNTLQVKSIYLFIYFGISKYSTQGTVDLKGSMHFIM
jgi:hypothetical protein